MAQASNAQREPSMEEILASIRRIIEDNEPRQDPEIARIEPAIGPAANDVTPNKDTVTMEAVRPDPYGRSALERTPVDRALGATYKKPEPTNPIEPVKQVETLAAATPQPVVEDPLAEFDELDGVEIDVEALSAAVAEETKREAETLRYSAPAMPAKAEVQLHDEEIQALAPRGSIISENTSRQVASAFGELSDVLASSRQRSVDDAAEAMLRPMLQDWLDNNLPVLVERLVREEIERVARGS